MNRAISILIFVASAVSAQTPKMPDSQRRFCEVLENWEYRGGYAKNAVPKVDPNPIKAAQAPKPPDPGNLFDQLGEVLGVNGSFAGWKGIIAFSVNGQAVQVVFDPYCPPPAKPMAEMYFETQSVHALPLKSAPAQFLASAESGDMVTVSGHLFYVPANRFYRETIVDRRGLRNLGAGRFFDARHGFYFEV